ncbi:MAG: hypothetical protein ACRDFB_08265 [Rhabdochlamydiaceae bacterium]
MTLIKLMQKLETFDNESTIYAAKPWTENSKALALHEPESGGLPPEAEILELGYFLEVSVARDFIENWAVSLDTAPTLQEKCLKLIQYAIKDA